MDTEKRPAERIRFGSYEVDLAACELRKSGLKLRLQPQPFQLLRLLLERTGEVVSREELKQVLWPDDTYVEFDLSLNTVIKKLRRALNDNPQNPRYIETLPRNGYRFIFPVERIDAADPDGAVVESILGDGSLLRSALDSNDARPATVFRIVANHEAAEVRGVGGSREAIHRDGFAFARKRRLLEAAGAVLAGALLFGVVTSYRSESGGVDPVRRWSFSAPQLTSAAISPDGRHILFAAQIGAESGLWIRPMDHESPKRVPGADRAAIGFWSPDSQSLAFAADGQLRRISLDGGDPTVLCPLPNPNTNLFAGGAWSPDGGSIIFSSGGRLHQVSASGGASRSLFNGDDNLRGTFEWPHFLPASGRRRAIVYSTSTNFRDRRMEVLDLDSGERRDLGPGSAPVYSSDGYLIYGPPYNELRGLKALPFSLATLGPTGDAFHVNQDGIGASVSDAGDLVYWDNPRPVALQRLAWKDRNTGRVLELVGEAQVAMRDPVISPDGQRVLVSSIESGDSDVYVHDLARAAKVRLTSESAQEAGGRWSADGSKVIFWRQTGDETALVEKAPNSVGAGTILYAVRGAILNFDWSRDDQHLALVQHASAGSREIRYLDAAKLGEGVQLALYPGRPSRIASPRISPDGRYLAFESSESGRIEVFVGSFPDGTQLRHKISTRGGRSPRWSPDGTELFYLQGSSLMAVSAQAAGRAIAWGSPRELFSSPDLSLGFEPSADAQRFLTIMPDDETPAPAVHVVENWHEGLDWPASEASVGW